MADLNSKTPLQLQYSAGVPEVQGTDMGQALQSDAPVSLEYDPIVTYGSQEPSQVRYPYLKSLPRKRRFTTLFELAKVQHELKKDEDAAQTESIVLKQLMADLAKTTEGREALANKLAMLKAPVMQVPVPSMAQGIAGLVGGALTGDWGGASRTAMQGAQMDAERTYQQDQADVAQKLRVLGLEYEAFSDREKELISRISSAYELKEKQGFDADQNERDRQTDLQKNQQSNEARMYGYEMGYNRGVDTANINAGSRERVADTRLEGQKYVADTRLDGTKYVADKRLRGVEYSTDAKLKLGQMTLAQKASQFSQSLAFKNQQEQNKFERDYQGHLYKLEEIERKSALGQWDAKYGKAFYAQNDRFLNRAYESRNKALATMKGVEAMLNDPKTADGDKPMLRAQMQDLQVQTELATDTIMRLNDAKRKAEGASANRPLAR